MNSRNRGLVFAFLYHLPLSALFKLRHVYPCWPPELLVMMLHRFSVSTTRLLPLTPEDNYLVRSPLLDPQRRVLGYKLAWQKTDGLKGAEALIELISGSPVEGWPGTVFLQGNPLPLPLSAGQPFAPHNMAWVVNHEALSETDYPALAALREKGYGLALRGADLAFVKANKILLGLVTHLEVHEDIFRLTEIAHHVAQHHPAVAVLAGQSANWADFEACAALGIPVFFEALCRSPRAMKSSGVLSSQATLILQLMQMVQENADVRHVEKLLKNDAVLSYKLFRYINSASFGIEVEIQSLRHAVAMLGYTPLFRWLSLLLAMASTVSFSPALLQAAIIRGRLTELLGQGLLSKSEMDDLFVVGMFSLLEQILGIPVSQVVNQLALPGAIAQALLSREGKYGPFILLADECEREGGCTGNLADTLFLTASSVNNKHLSAMAWAQGIKF